MKKNLFLGIDLGTSSVKVNLIDDSGELLVESSQEYEVLGASDGFFEQRPGDWIDAIAEAVSALRVADVEGTIKGIGLSAQMPTLTLTSREGRPFGNAILWCDARAEAQAVSFIEAAGKKEHYNKTGVILDGRYIAPMYMWLRDQGSPLLLREHYVLSAKDFLYYSLCGEPVTDPSTASGFGLYNVQTGEWDRELCQLAGIPMECLPEIKNSFDAAGRLTLEMAERLGIPAGTPVACGAADSVAGVLAICGTEEGTVCGMCGSSTALIAICDSFKTDLSNGYFITPLAAERSFGMEADILSTGSAQQWLLSFVNSAADATGNFRMEFDDLWRLAAQVPVGAEGLVFTPYLMGGEQGVLWDTTLTAGIFGLTPIHSISHLARACVEGICFEVRRCVEAFQAGGLELKRLVLSGPATEDAFYMQTMADVMGVPCFSSDMVNASAYGAAVMGGGRGIQRTLGKSYEPQAADVEKYQTCYSRYLDASANSRIG